MRVAILDDDPSIRTALGRFLEAAGISVNAHDTGDQLFASLVLQRPDCLLLDFQMPGMSGLDVLQHLGQRLIRLPTIMITSHDAAGLRSACLNAGALAYLTKPLDPEHLVQMIGGICGPATQAADVAAPH